jgi:hypothetical protein
MSGWDGIVRKHNGTARPLHTLHGENCAGGLAARPSATRQPPLLLAVVSLELIVRHGQDGGQCSRIAPFGKHGGLPSHAQPPFAGSSLAFIQRSWPTPGCSACFVCPPAALIAAVNSREKRTGTVGAFALLLVLDGWS